MQQYYYCFFTLHAMNQKSATLYCFAGDSHLFLQRFAKLL